MTSANRFSDAESAEGVHHELRTLLCCDFLHEKNCRQNFRRFKLRCRNHFTTPSDQNLSKSTKILDRLEEKGLFGVNNYRILKNLVKGTGDAVTDLIKEAEEMISSFTGDTDEPCRKKQKTDQKSSTEKDVNEYDVKNLKDRLKEVNTLETEVIPVSPLQEENKLPVEQIYASVVIREDLRYHSRMRGPAGKRKIEKHKKVTSPNDIFTIGGKSTRHVYMQGDSARGKTTYCLWLLKQWCDAQQCSTVSHSEWGKAMKEFDFAFYVPLRHVDPLRVTVTDMICMDVLHEDPNLHRIVEHVLLNDRYRCLILIDGLDEWNQDEQVKKKLRCEALPNFGNISNCVHFITMRPWIFKAVAQHIRNNDRVIEINGFNKKGIKTAIKNVLVNHYRLSQGTQLYREGYNEIVELLEYELFASIMQIPLITVLFVQMQHKKRFVANNTTDVYAALIDMLIERASQKHNFEYISVSKVDDSLPKPLSENENIAKYYTILLKFGKMAYEGILLEKDRLVFQKSKLEKEIGESEVQFGLDVGLISQKDKSSEIRKNVSIEFFHTSIQKFLAVIYIVAQKDVTDSFYNHLTSVDIMLQLSNVIMFICGMLPSLGISVSQQFVRTIKSNTQEFNIREYTARDTVIALVALHQVVMKWYMELKDGQSLKENRLKFHIPLVCLFKGSNKEKVRVTRELLSDPHVCIFSLFIVLLPSDGECGITDKELDDFLSNTDKTGSLATLCIKGHNADRSVHTICIPSLKTLHLANVKIQKINQNDNVCPPVLINMTQLTHLILENVNLDDKRLGLSTNMVNLEYIKLFSVNMSAAEWKQIITVLRDIHRKIQIKLCNTNIDNETLTMIRSTRIFKERKNDMKKLHFTRV